MVLLVRGADVRLDDGIMLDGGVVMPVILVGPARGVAG